ncbi:MAG TPA: AMP-binding protein [Candidatus Acidoferrum sp.]|nr:AMP-binding protein [Candidatus Acidoferrum sp.]
MPRESLLSLFHEFPSFGKSVAVIQRRGYRREKVTYAELHARSISLAQILSKHGIQAGDRILLWGANSAEWIAAFWAILLRGAIAVPMDPAASQDFVRKVVSDASVHFVFCDRKLARFLELLPSLALDDFTNSAASPLSAENEARSATFVPKRSEVVEILYTSGTTSEPRGVVLTHGNFLANLDPLEQGILPYRKYEKWFHPLRFVTLVPLSHVFGQFMALFVPPLLAATIVFESSANPSEMIRTVKQERATVMIAVPRMLDALHAGILRGFEARGETRWLNNKFAAAAGRKFLARAWRFRNIHRRFGWKFWAFISGGAALSRDTEEFFKRIGYAVVQGYGMTESASLITLNHPFRAAEGTIGKALAGCECKLAEDGEILVRGENVASGYWRNGALRQEIGDAEHWLHTGDLGELDAQGNLRFKGRKKGVIVTPAGLNVHPEDVEAAIRKQFGVRDCVVLSRNHEGNAEPFAVLLMEGESSGQQEAARTALAFANATLAEFQRPRQWFVWPDADFPRTPAGKPRLALIAERSAGLNGAARPGGPGGDLRALLAGFSHSVAGSQELESDLNLSSLDRVELMSALEERYQVELNETAFAEAKSLADVQRLLQRPAARRTEYVYPRWTQHFFSRLLRLGVYYSLVWPATQFLGHPRIVGRENLRSLRGPALFVSNHITRRADIGLILAALPIRFRHRLATVMGGESLERMRRPPGEWFFARRWAYQVGYGLVILLFNVFPLPQHSGFRESFRFAGESVDRGFSILAFPEGEVNNSVDGRMAPFQNGVGILAENLHLPIVPFRLDGVWQMKRQHRRLARFGELTVRIGTPVSFAPQTPPEEIARELQRLVLAL